jgi:hypothetical protein
MDRHFEAAFLGGEMRGQPRQLADFLVAGERQDKSGAAYGFEFDDFRDFDLAHSPVHPAFPLEASFLAPKMLVSGGVRNGSYAHPARYRFAELKERAMPELSISAEKVGFLIEKAREFDVKEAASDPDSGSNAADDGMIDVLEDNGNDPVVREITGFVSALTEDEQIDLVALMRLGRGDATIEEWPDLRRETAESRDGHVARTLLGEPMLGDLLAEGLGAFGLSWADERITPVK